MSAVLMLVIVALLAILPHAYAQQDQERLTDNEVRAAYCFGYLKAGQQSLQGVCQTLPPPIAQECSAGEQEQNSKTQRILGYLLTKDIFLSPGTNATNDVGATVAVAQGRADFQSCIDWSKTPKGLACSDKCAEPDAGKSMACLDACMPTLCRKGAACADLTYLPY